MTSHEIRIREYQEEEEAQLDSLLSNSFDNPWVKQIIKGKKKLYAFTAFDCSKMIAVCVAWKSTFHPYCTYFSLFVHPAYCDVQLEERLLSLLIEQKEDNLPLQTSIWETSYRLKLFLEQNGFQEIRRTYTPKLNLDDVNCIPSRFLEVNQSIVSVTSILDSDYLIEQLANIVKKVYEETHLVNPLGVHDLERWKKMILGEDVVLEGSFLVLNSSKNEVLAYAFLHHSDQKDKFEFGWRGAIVNEYQKLLQMITYNQILYAKKLGMNWIEGEIDSTDKYALELLRHLPFSPAPAWITYQKSNISIS